MVKELTLGVRSCAFESCLPQIKKLYFFYRSIYLAAAKLSYILTKQYGEIQEAGEGLV